MFMRTGSVLCSRKAFLEHLTVSHSFDIENARPVRHDAASQGQNHRAGRAREVPGRSAGRDHPEGEGGVFSEREELPRLRQFLLDFRFRGQPVLRPVRTEIRRLRLQRAALWGHDSLVTCTLQHQALDLTQPVTLLSTSGC